MRWIFGRREVPGLLSEQNEIEKRLSYHVSNQEVDRAIPSLRVTGSAWRRDVYTFAPVPPYAARIECQVEGVQGGSFELGGEILWCVGWKPGESLSNEKLRRGGKVCRAKH